uniref:Chloroplast envelope membrane protein n=1 Tax=Hildenbrandia rivularis TaxID=135206 RepID=A0A1C9CFF2_9FLOR|nr:chloroplast envelope membrane protein [Hildenbrandia rivularis]AOM67121.1 chloroplast envelope membrane protein [Hildenbrandia rivularis]
MKNWNLQSFNISTFEKFGPVPRSITKTFRKFKQELNPNGESEVIKEFQVSRYQTIVSIKYIIILLLVPITINHVFRNFVLGPCIDYLWNQESSTVFLNSSQEERAFAELQRFEEKLHFEILIDQAPELSDNIIRSKIKLKALQLAKVYANESSDAIKNIFTDLFSITVFFILIILRKKQVSVLVSFLQTLVYKLSDTAKAFFIILVTDVFVGFHSPHGWEVVISLILRRFGLTEDRDFIFAFISTVPVVLDAFFKYWIFRYLNRISPSAVATYKNMNE